MNQMRPAIVLSLLILGAFLQSCTRQLAEPLRAIQDNSVSTAWEKLASYPVGGRSDDLHFFDPLTGFVINSNGYVYFTEDGGESWDVVLEDQGTFYRCITFKNRLEGWLGTIGTGDKDLYSKDSISLYETKDGGLNWSPVRFVGPNPKGLCGLQKVTDQMIVGTGRVRGPSYFIKTTDGGATWYSYDLNHLAGSLISAFFHDEDHGFLIGGTTNDKENSRSLVLETLDGGMSWDTIYLSDQIGEYPWKFSFPTREKGFISIQRNKRNGRCYNLQTIDGGSNWTEVEHAQEYYYAQGIGFINQDKGWIGGSRTWTYETTDGGNTWDKVKGIGNGFNNFQFFGDSLAYGVGFGVYKNSDVQSTLQNEQKTYYANGELRGKYSIVNGKRNGMASVFHANGKLASEGTYKRNLKDGKWRYFDEVGKLIFTSKIRNGVSSVSKRLLSTYVGRYKLDNGELRDIILENGQLYSQRGEGEKYPIYAENKTQFYYGFNPDITIQFVQNAKRDVVSTKSFQNGIYTTAEKMLTR